jgi:hypothetical protein
MSKKFDSFNYQYTLLVLDGNEQRLTGLVSCHELPATKTLSRSCLRLTENAVYVDIYPYRARLAELEGVKRVVRISQDKEQQ